MIPLPLPVCRWREGQYQDHYVCRSAKFVHPPNLVTADFCAQCPHADHEQPAPLPHALPCVHLGEPVASAVARPDGELTGESFRCAVHGKCIIADTTPRPADISHTCASCPDYLARDPFGPTSVQMLRQAEEYLAAVPEYPSGRYQGRGIVIAGGGDRFFPSLYVTVRALRHLGCNLPIQVWYLGRKKEMPAEKKALLASYQVECVDADKIRRRYPARRLGGWELKVFATLHSSFEELLFLDADCYPCRNPDFLFALPDFLTKGAIFWPDGPTFDARLKWPAFGVHNPGRPGSVESGQFVLNKRLCWLPLNLAWHFNDHSDYYYRYCHGDKHTFEVAWARCGRSFVMWEPKAHWLEVAYLHRGPDHLPLFIHRCRDKFRFKNHAYTTKQHYALPSFHSSLPMERECWEWLADLARLTGRTLTHRQTTIIPTSTPQPNCPRFAIATLFTPENRDLGQRTAKEMRAYAKRHGYEAIIARARIDVSRPSSWSKLLVIERYLSENPSCAWLLWLNADAVITKPAQRLEDLIDENVDFLVAAGLPSHPINTGIFLMRNCPAALDMLRRAYAKVQFIHHPGWERPAVAEALRDCTDTLRTRVVSKRVFNSFADEYQEGDFIIHFEGYSHEAKLAGVLKAIAKAAGHSHSLANPRVSATERVRELLPMNVQPMAAGPESSSHSERPWTDLPPMYCITCWQMPQRTAQAVRHFKERGLKVQFFPGIHGKTFGLRTALLAGPSKRLLAGEVGCLMSHYMLWQTLAYLPHEEILILEDDAWFAPTFRQRFQRAYADLPKDWQFVFVGAVEMAGKPVEQITERVGVMRYPCGTHAYLLKRSALPFLLQTNHQARKAIDLQLMENSFPAMKCYTFTPSLVKQRSAYSPHEGTGEQWPTSIRVPDNDIIAP